MRRSFTVHKQLIGFAIFAMLMCFCGFMQRVQADNADLGGVNLSIQYRVCKNDSFSLLSMFPSQNEPEPFIIQYGDETVTIPHKEEYNYQDPDGNYYSYPRYVLKSGWLDGKAIKLVNVPVPDGYELCISGQPVVTNESIGFGTNYISLSIPIRKAGEKVVMSNMNEIHTDIEVVDGKPVVTVTNGWYPLTEGVDYTLSWQYLQNQFSLQVTVNGIGTYTGSMVGDTELASKFNKETIKSLVGEIPGVTDEDTGSDNGSQSGSGQDNNTQPSDPDQNAAVTLKKGDTFYNGKYRYRITKVSGKKGNVTVIGLKNKKTTTISIQNTVKQEGYTFTVNAIGSKAFKNNRYIKKVTTGKSLRTIGSEAFYKCTSLTTLKISTGVTTIGKKAFYGCKKLKTISLPRTLDTIGDYAFYQCTSLTSLSLPKGLKTIGTASFARCTKLTKVTIPATVTTIKAKAFYGSKKLKSVRIYSTVLKKAGSKCFGGISSKAVIKVPAKKVAAYKKLLKVKNVRK